jgi:hypothetical protein
MARRVASWSAGTGTKPLTALRAVRVVDMTSRTKAARSLDSELEGG